MAKEILCAFGVDVDAVAGWLGSYGGEDSPDDISRGLFAGEVGTPRLLKLFERDRSRTVDVPGRILVGGAYVDEDESRSVVRSVLDALNRLLPDLKTP